MKIGILTYHRTLNYGACLQALATRGFLQKYGHDVFYVDYWPDYHRQMYAIFNKNKFSKLNWKGKLYYIYNVFKTYPYVRKRKKKFELYHKNYTYPFCKSLTDKYDVIIYGSDQIWRKQFLSNDFNPIYFGENNLDTKFHVAFSASMGVLPNEPSDERKLKKLLSNFKCISVRESELKNYIIGIGNFKVQQTLDPTFLLSKEEWEKALPTQTYSGRKYILVYTLGEEVFDMKSIYSLAKKQNFLVKKLRGFAHKMDTETDLACVGPEDFLFLIKNAEYVFTSSFHGLAFSLIFHKQVIASFKSNSVRAKSLLSIAGIPERYFENNQIFDDNIPLLNYDLVETKITKQRKFTISYLINALN